MCSGFGDLLDVAQRLQHNVAQLHRSLCLFMGQVRIARWFPRGFLGSILGIFSVEVIPVFLQLCLEPQKLLFL